MIQLYEVAATTPLTYLGSSVSEVLTVSNLVAVCTDWVPGSSAVLAATPYGR